MSAALAKIAEIEAEMARTQKNKVRLLVLVNTTKLWLNLPLYCMHFVGHS